MKLSIRGLPWIMLIFMLLMGFGTALAQDDMEDEDEASVEAPCHPESFETTFDKFAADSITNKQISIWYSFGQEEFKHKQYNRAIPYYWKVLVNDKVGTFKVVYRKLATCYEELAKSSDNQAIYIDSTRLIIYRGLDAIGDNVRLHFEAGKLQRTLRNYRCAIPHYEALAKANPKQVNYLMVLSDLYDKTDDCDKAMEYQQKVVDLSPGDTEAQAQLGRLMIRCGLDPKEAVLKMWLADTTNIANGLRLAREAMDVGENKLALRAVNGVIAVDNDNIEARVLKARAYENLNDNSNAIATYKGILDIEPKNLEVLSSLAFAYSLQKSFTTATRYVNQAIQIDPNYGQSYIVMGEILIAAVDDCSSKRGGTGSYSYDDKLIFEKAAGWFRRARRDPNFAARGDSRADGLRTFFRNAEDKHLYSNRENIKDDCYGWVR